MHVGRLGIPTREGVGKFVIFLFGGFVPDIDGVTPFLDVGFIEEGVIAVHELHVIGHGIGLRTRWVGG